MQWSYVAVWDRMRRLMFYLFEMTIVGVRIRSKRWLLAFTGGISGGTHTFFPFTLPFLRAVDSLVITAAWNLN